VIIALTLTARGRYTSRCCNKLHPRWRLPMSLGLLRAR
jgi:hypothetical protein